VSAAPDTMVLLTYATAADAAARGYEDWLRASDNPFFNSIAGVARYDNWKIVNANAPLDWTHFDFLALSAADDLARVWFSDALDEFRKGWVRRWGYGAATPAPVNRFGYRLVRVGGSAPRGNFVALRGFVDRPAGRDNVELWRVTHAVRKHYAIGPAPAGESWLVDIAQNPGPGFRWLSVEYRHAQGELPEDGTPALLATLIAGPPW
jgi:hypothetical protein